MSTAAAMIFDWLRESDSPPSFADAAIGFGHFDLRIPRLCGELARGGKARTIVFTGGIGAGTGQLGGPEADAFLRELLRLFPELKRVVTENRSTNTAENIRFTAELLQQSHPDLALGGGIRSAILIAHSIRLRRVRQTWRRLCPQVPAVGISPATDYATEAALYAKNGLSLTAQLGGEVDRLRQYPTRGWIEPIEIPPAIAAARAELPA